MGFITARVAPLRDCNASDRALLGLGSPFLDSMQVHGRAGDPRPPMTLPAVCVALHAAGPSS